MGRAMGAADRSALYLMAERVDFKWVEDGKWWVLVRRASTATPATSRSSRSMTCSGRSGWAAVR